MLENIEQLIDQSNYWIGHIFLVVFATLLAAYFSRKVMNKLLQRAHKTHNLWDDALVGAAQQPVRYFIWLIGLTIAAQLTLQHSNSDLLQFVLPIRKIGIMVLIAWLLVRLIRRVEMNVMNPEFTKKPMDETTVLAIGKLLRISVIITTTLVVLQSMGYSISGVLAFGGIGGIAVGFAAKDLLANFFGGLMIYLDRPFSVGDWIRSPDQEIEGTVEDIGWRLTRIRTFDKRPLYIPNASFTHISVENPSRMTNRRIYETVGVRYEDAGKVAVIIEQVKEYLEQHVAIDKNQTLIVNLNKFSASSLDFFIYTFTKTTDWVTYHEIKQDVLLGVLNVVERNGAECAFPTSTVHLPDPVVLENSNPSKD